MAPAEGVPAPFAAGRPLCAMTTSVPLSWTVRVSSRTLVPGRVLVLQNGWLVHLRSSGGAHGGTDASLCRCRHRASWKVGAQGREPGRFWQTNSDYGRTSGDWMRRKDASSGDPLGSVRGRPNLVITLLSKRVIALTLSPARVMTKRPKMWATPEVGSWR
jgi:hypothetical protein